MTFKIYVADLAEYNKGRLVGKWFDMFDYKFGSDLEDDIQDMLDANNNEEWAVHDYDCDFDVSGFGEYPDLDGLINLKDALEYNEDTVIAFLEYWGIRDLVHNLTDWDDIILHHGIDDETQLGMMLLEDAEIPDHLDGYIDYEAYGRDYSINASGGFTSKGFIEWIG